MKILTAQQLAIADEVTIKKQEISSYDLMERAAGIAFQRIHEQLKGTTVAINVFCGIGNNGGDGLVIARQLIEHDYHVNVYITNCSKKRSANFLKSYDLLKSTTNDWPVLLSCKEDFPQIDPQDIIIDAIFGTGLNRPITGWMANLIMHLNDIPALKIAIDLPSGMFANTAHNSTDTILNAHYTLTFQTPKICFFFPITAIYVGEYEIIDIGLDIAYLESVVPMAQLVTKQLAKSKYKNRKKFTHKGDFGHVMTFAGSKGKMGAAVLCAGAAINAGAGKVTAYIPKSGNYILQTSLPEVMTLQSDGVDFITDFEHDLKDITLCAGPGIGVEAGTYLAFAKAIQQQSTPIVIDADAINILAHQTELLKELPENSILTPHDGELQRLLGPWENSYERLEKASQFATKHQLILVLKGAHTITVTASSIYINNTGNPGMATAGSGDVLSGIIASFLAQGYEPAAAAVLAVYLHGASGDIAASTHAFEGVTASIICKYIGNSVLQLLQ